ncbi:hypothetical protein Sango_1066600 [Sesamum angolense]|uniref:Uncharacterized protein n=1 Tax=Sesamum angolense TaxID=2727404 RepID=A0AAE2BW43_9LAMI|nr:hypothetical protein Sango_1066600 [Sesamum angolense]
MGFTMEFAENLMLGLMEDPRELRELLYELKDRSRCNKTEGNVELARPYGFWESQMTSSRLPPNNCLLSHIFYCFLYAARCVSFTN